MKGHPSFIGKLDTDQSPLPRRDCSFSSLEKKNQNNSRLKRNSWQVWNLVINSQVIYEQLVLWQSRDDNLLIAFTHNTVIITLFLKPMLYKTRHRPKSWYLAGIVFQGPIVKTSYQYAKRDSSYMNHTVKRFYWDIGFSTTESGEGIFLKYLNKEQTHGKKLIWSISCNIPHTRV